jgi:hypothetical protein
MSPLPLKRPGQIQPRAMWVWLTLSPMAPFAPPPLYDDPRSNKTKVKGRH